MIHWLRDRRDTRKDAGYAAILTALLLVPLMGFAGFAVDVGAWYGRAAELQRAADSAALAGVVMQPSFADAEVAARAAATRNGFTHGVDGMQVLISDSGENELSVEIIDTDADLYFAALFIDNVTIGRSALAEFNKPVALGSPDSTLGQQMPDGCDELIKNDGSTCSGAGPHPGFFLDVAGPVGVHRGGEPLTTQCLGSGYGTGSCDYANPEFDADGYIFAIDVPASGVGSPITVQIFDPSHADTGGDLPDWGNGTEATNAAVNYVVYDADGSGLTTPRTTEIAGCHSVFDGVYDVAEAAMWVTLCTFTPTQEDIYPLQVRTSGFVGANADGVSQSAYSLRATSTGTDPSLYALNYLGVLSNSDASTIFTFAEILDDHAGKTIRMRLFDAGDGSGTLYTLVPLDPDGDEIASCEYRSYTAGSDPDSATWNSSDSGSRCEVDTRVGGSSLYNDLWLDIDIDIPLSYSCGTTCWWSVNYELSADAVFYERTTWTVQIVGDPVRLLE